VAEARGPPPTLLPVTASYQDFLTTWLASLVLWVPVDIVLFRFVPVAAQVYVVKSIDIIALLGFSYFVNKHPSPRPPRAQAPRAHRMPMVPFVVVTVVEMGWAWRRAAWDGFVGSVGAVYPL